MNDSHINVVVTFDVPEGRDITAHVTSLYQRTSGGTRDCLYYGFARSGQKYLCREGYRNAKSFLKHLGEIKDHSMALRKQIETDLFLVDSVRYNKLNK